MGGIKRTLSRYRSTGIIALAVLILAGGIYLFTISSSEEEYRNTTKLFPASEDGIPSDRDTDGDGLKDWEEVLWGTDPANNDSDSDGTPDGTEIKNDRNPTVAGPNDRLSSHPAFQSPEQEIKSSTSSTDRIATRFISDYLTLKMSGTPLNTTVKQNLVSSALESADISLAASYTQNDITAVSEKTVSLHYYGNQIGGIFRSRTPANMPDEYQLIAHALYDNDFSRLHHIEISVDAYDGIINDLIETRVPQALADEHVGLINRVAVLKKAAEMMRTAKSDPVAAMVAVNRYPRYQRGLSDALVAIGTVLNSNDVTYEKYEPGYDIAETIPQMAN